MLLPERIFTACFELIGEHAKHLEVFCLSRSLAANLKNVREDLFDLLFIIGVVEKLLGVIVI